MFTRAQIDNYVEDFNRAALTRDVWTHEAHLIIAVCFLKRYRYIDDVMETLRPAIIRLNNVNGIANTGVSGYHETVTRFMLMAVDFFLYHQPETDDLTQNVNAVIKSDLSLSKFPFFFYSHGHLLSYESRTRWQESDLRPMSDLSKLLQVGAGI